MLFTIVKGSGSSKVSELNAFDAALLEAGIGDTNLMRLSSIIPPLYREAPLKEFKTGLWPGIKLPVAYAVQHRAPGEPECVITAGVAVAVSQDPEKAGLIMESTAVAHLPESVASDHVEEVLRKMIREGMDLRGRSEYSIRIVVQSKKTTADSYHCVVAAVPLLPTQPWRC